jgi:hypothetical protein
VGLNIPIRGSGGWASFYMSVLVRNGSGNASFPKYFGVCYTHLLPLDNAGVFTDDLSKLFPRLCLSTPVFHIVIYALSSRFFKLPWCLASALIMSWLCHDYSLEYVMMTRLLPKIAWIMPQLDIDSVLTISWLWLGYAQSLLWWCLGYALILPWSSLEYALIMPLLCLDYELILPALIWPWL